MDLDTYYILFQFEYQPKGDAASRSSIHAIKFKFSKELKTNRKKTIENYFNSFLREEKEKAWKLFSSDLIFNSYEEIENAIKEFNQNFSADWEIISKSEYKEWKEQEDSPSNPITFI